MNNTEFRKIKSIAEYLIDGLINMRLQQDYYRKSAEITARQGIIGEEIVTVMSNGLEETRNTVTADENGEPGFVVTNPSGEQYIVAASVFRSKYEKIKGTENRYRPSGGPVTAVQINESISFVAPWGEVQNLAAGGYLVFDEAFKDIYGIQEEEFNNTYYCLTPSNFKEFVRSPEFEKEFYEYLYKINFEPVTEGLESIDIFKTYFDIKKGITRLDDLFIMDQLIIVEMKALESAFITSKLYEYEKERADKLTNSESTDSKA